MACLLLGPSPPLVGACSQVKDPEARPIGPAWPEPGDGAAGPARRRWPPPRHPGKLVEVHNAISAGSTSNFTVPSFDTSRLTSQRGFAFGTGAQHRRFAGRSRASAGKVRRTPVLELRGEDLGVAARVVLKLEHTQHTGSFKPRGALNALLTRDIPPAGVVAASGGNHGAAVAWAAARLGVPATIFVPATSPPAKAVRIASYGAQVHVVDGYYDEAVVAAQTYAADHEVTSVHAFDEPAVVAGQGTLGLELREQVPDASAVLVTVGGGGLASGVTLACRDGGPSVVPIEPTSCPTLAARSLPTARWMSRSAGLRPTVRAPEGPVGSAFRFCGGGRPRTQRLR